MWTTKKHLWLLCLALVLVAGPAWADIESDLLAYYPFGDAATSDVVGGFDATLTGSAQLEDEAERGAVLRLAAAAGYIEYPLIARSVTFTYALWVQQITLETGLRTLIDTTTWASGSVHYELRDGRLKVGVNGLGADLLSPDALPTGEWHHMAVTKDEARLVHYLDGVEVAGRDSANTLECVLGQARSEWSGGRHANVYVDEVRVYNRSLSADDIAELFTFVGNTELAGKPIPEDGLDDVDPTTDLSWSPGEFAAEHDLYLGTDFDEVNDADTTAAVYQGRLGEARFAPEALALGQTYFWRVDEVNAAPDKTVFKGGVWSFTLEPVAFAVPSAAVTATASSQMANQDPNHTVDASGLDAADGHSSNTNDMWLAAPTDAEPWIQFDFAQLEELDRVHVWNHNSQTEGLLGFGVKEARIEASRDGETWTEVATVTLAQAGGTDGETGEDVALNGTVAQSIRIVALSNWSLLPAIKQKGLSEVRFYAVPTRARRPVPADGAAVGDPRVALSWRSGRHATQHEVLVGTDPNALSAAGTTAAPALDIAADLDSTVYWQVRETNDALDPAAWDGPLWSFTTEPFLSVDEMESYKSKDGFWVWETWLDGFDDPANGALLGHGGDDMETGIVYAGQQSLPFAYGQNGAGVSEASRPVTGDWSQHGIVSLSLMFAGQASNTPGRMYLKVNGVEVASYPTPDDLKRAQWQPWIVVLPAAARGPVQSLTLGFEGGSGLIYVDAIRLYPREPETVTPVQPDAAGLVAHYPFDADFSDVAGGHDGTPVGDAAVLADAQRGSVLAVDGVADAVEVPDLGDANSVTIAAWFNASMLDMAGAWQSLFHTNGWTPGAIHFRLRYGRVDGGINGGAGGAGRSVVVEGEWHQAALAGTLESLSFWLDGREEYTASQEMLVGYQLGDGLIGAWSNNGTIEREFSGRLDDVRIYDRALSEAELAGLAGRTEPLTRPF